MAVDEVEELDFGDVHQYLHYDSVLAMGVPHKWPFAIGKYYTTDYLGPNVLLQVYHFLCST